MNKGFTLIELLIAIGVIAVMSTVSVVSYQSINENNRDQTRFRNLNDIKQALELYRHDKHYYPATLAEITTTYLNTIPVDPLSPTRNYTYRSYDSSMAVCATTSSSCINFSLCAAIEGNRSFSNPGNCTTCGTTKCMSIINE